MSLTWSADDGREMEMLNTHRYSTVVVFGPRTVNTVFKTSSNHEVNTSTRCLGQSDRIWNGSPLSWKSGEKEKGGAEEGKGACPGSVRLGLCPLDSVPRLAALHTSLAWLVQGPAPPPSLLPPDALIHSSLTPSELQPAFDRLHHLSAPELWAIRGERER
ncbi:hypothetical protein EYF80_039017 [Liparis tanakae]|uniref:Uncharacterized protein n=1 Tax=Liparis tanakae TaxID=230148 RepID=A0A4Z2GCF8_9TELE|nr:hypothetical protein EYF80_039017 [Liparis tanakae]